MALDRLLDRRYARVLRQILQLNRQPQFQAASYGEEFRSTTSSARGPHPMLIGFIIPDVAVNYVPIKRNVGKKYTYSAISPPVGNKKTNGGITKDSVEAINRLSNKFWNDYIAMCGRLGMKPEDLLPILLGESGLQPGSTNGNAKGISQLIYDTAVVKLGMSKADWDNFDSWSAEDQLPWTEKFYSSVKVSKWSGPTQLYVANLAPSRVGVASNPGATIYNGYPEYRDPPGTIVANKNIPQPGSPEWNKIIADGKNPKAITAEMANYDGNAGLDKDKRGFIKVSDTTKYAEAQIGSEAYQVAIQKIKDAQAGLLPNEPEEPVPPLDGTATSSIISGAADLTDGEYDDPMKMVGRHISVDEARAEVVKKQVDELRQQIEIAKNVPALQLLINPNTFSRRYEHQVDYAKGRRRPIVSMWHEKPVVISGKGTTAAQYAIRQSGEGGLTSSNRINSLAYENLISLASIYRNNGLTFTSGLGDSSNSGVPLISMSVYIYYDGTVYIGSFDSFSISDSAEKPFNLEYSFDFTCRYEVPIGSYAETLLSGGFDV